MVITVARTNRTKDGIFGNLSIDVSPFKCVTEENLILAIKSGIYPVQWMWSEHFQQVMPSILVPGRTAIEIHWANVPNQLEGCIALGTSIEIENNWINESKIAWVGFVKSIVNQPTITIKVIE